MHFVITGATGLIGRSVTAECLRLGHHVTALVRDTKDGRLPADPHLTVREWDLGRPDNDAMGAREYDVLLHLAAYIPSDMGDPGLAEECFQHNTFAVRDLVNIAARSGVSQFVLASAGSLYVNRGVPASEDDPVYPPGHAPYYLASKLAGEVFARHSAQRHGLTLTILRVASVYGSGMRRNAVVARFLAEAKMGIEHTVSQPDHTADFVYVDDVASACIAAAARQADGIFNVGSGRATSLRELSRITRAVADRTEPAGPRHTGHSHGRLTGFPALDIRRAAAALAFQPTALNTGLERMLGAAKSG